MNDKMIVTEPEMSCILPCDGEYIVMLNGQPLTTLVGKTGDRVSLHMEISSAIAEFKLANNSWREAGL